MAALVVREDPALLLGQHLLLLEPGDDALERVVEVRLRRDTRRSRRPAKIAASLQMFASSAPVRPLVWRAIWLRSTPGSERLAARVHLEDRDAALEVRRRHEHLPVEASGPQQRLVEVLDTVRRAHHDDLVRAFEAVELDEQLVERLILLAVEAVAGALCADGVELVDEDDRRRVLARLREELANAGCAEPGEHLDERRRARGVEVRARLVRDRLREQRLAGARRPVEKQAFRHLRAEPLETLRVAEELDDLHQLARGPPRRRRHRPR